MSQNQELDLRALRAKLPAAIAKCSAALHGISLEQRKDEAMAAQAVSLAQTIEQAELFHEQQTILGKLEDFADACENVVAFPEDPTWIPEVKELVTEFKGLFQEMLHAIRCGPETPSAGA